MIDTENVAWLRDYTIKTVDGKEFETKKRKKALLQLINYGFDQKLKVYPDPYSESGVTSVGGVAVSGGQIRTYFVVNGDESFMLNKNFSLSFCRK